MSEDAKLFLLKDRLTIIRKDRRNYKVIGLVLVFILLFAIDFVYLRLDPIIGMVVAGSLFFILSFGIDVYYQKEERNILLQI